MKKFFLCMAIVFTYSQGFSQSGTCAGATELVVTDPGDEFDFTLTPVNVDQTTVGKGDNGGNTTPDIFYYITPNVVRTINIGLCQFNNFDSEIKIYSDCTLTTLIAENDDGSCGTSSEVSFQSDGVSTYYILIEGNENPLSPPLSEGIFGVSVWYTAAVPTPPIAQGINCNSSTSGPSLLFTDELDVQGTWTGDIATSQAGGSSNSGMWEIISTGGALSNNTGPSGPFSGTTYMNYEASGNNSDATASAVSEAIDLSGTITEDVELSFYMHAFGNEMGTLNVGISTSPSGPFTTEFTWAGQFQSAETDPWFKVGVDLSSYLGQTIYIEFSHIGLSSNTFRGDMSIDLVEVNACDTVLDVNEENILENLTVFPNPVNDILNLRAQENIETISIYNLLGQEVLRTQPKVLNTDIDMSNLPTGMYVVKVQVGDSIGSYKIVKN